MLHPQQTDFIGVISDSTRLRQCWWSNDLQDIFWLDFNNYKSFRCAMLLHCDNMVPENAIKVLWKNPELRREMFWKLSKNWLDLIIEQPGAIHYSFDATNDRILVEMTGH